MKKKKIYTTIPLKAQNYYIFNLLQCHLLDTCREIFQGTLCITPLVLVFTIRHKRGKKKITTTVVPCLCRVPSPSDVFAQIFLCVGKIARQLRAETDGGQKLTHAITTVPYFGLDIMPLPKGSSPGVVVFFSREHYQLLPAGLSAGRKEDSKKLSCKGVKVWTSLSPGSLAPSVNCWRHPSCFAWRSLGQMVHLSPPFYSLPFFILH